MTYNLQLYMPSCEGINLFWLFLSNLDLEISDSNIVKCHSFVKFMH